MISIARCTERLLSCCSSTGTLAARSAKSSVRVIELGQRKRARRKAPFGGLAAGHRIARQHQLHGAAHADQPRMILHVGRRSSAAPADSRSGRRRRHRRCRRRSRVRCRRPGNSRAPARSRAWPDPRSRTSPRRRGATIGRGPPPNDRADRPCCRRRDRSRPKSTDPPPRTIVIETSPIAIGLLQHLEHFGAQPVVQRVALFRPVQRDAPHPRPGIVDENVLIGHLFLHFGQSAPALFELYFF